MANLYKGSRVVISGPNGESATLFANKPPQLYWGLYVTIQASAGILIRKAIDGNNSRSRKLSPNPDGVKGRLFVGEFVNIGGVRIVFVSSQFRKINKPPHMNCRIEVQAGWSAVVEDPSPNRQETSQETPVPLNRVGMIVNGTKQTLGEIFIEGETGSIGDKFSLAIVRRKEGSLALRICAQPHWWTVKTKPPIIADEKNCYPLQAGQRFEIWADHQLFAFTVRSVNADQVVLDFVLRSFFTLKRPSKITTASEQAA